MTSLKPAFQTALNNLLELNSSLFDHWYQTLFTIHGEWIEDELNEENLSLIEKDVMNQIQAQ